MIDKIINPSAWLPWPSIEKSGEKILQKGDSTRTKDLQRKTEILAKRMGFAQTPHVIEYNDHSWSAHGYSLEPSFPGIITVSKDALNPSYKDFYLPASHTFTLAHELAHLHRQDFQRSRNMGSWVIVALGINIVWVSLFACAFTSVYVQLLGTSIYLISLTSMVYSCKLNSQLHEKQADLMACKYTSDEEKLGFITWFHTQLKGNLDYRNAPGLSFLESLRRKMQIDPLGNNLEDNTHPPMTERIRYIQETMIKKPLNYDPEKFYRKSMRNTKGPTFFKWLDRQSTYDSEGNLRSSLGVALTTSKTTCLFPFYVGKYYFDR